jgi:hypothetical protein
MSSRHTLKCGICNKVGYVTRERAEAAARVYSKLYKRQRAYRGRCGWFHLGTR